MAAALRADMRPPMVIENPRGKGEVILLIDDERSIRDIARQTLQSFGYQVSVAGDGIEGIAQFMRHANETNLVFTDMEMPNCDGPSTILALRRTNPGLRIVATSGLETHRDRVRDVSGFLVKSYSAERMLRLICEVLDRPTERIVDHHPVAT